MPLDLKKQDAINALIRGPTARKRRPFFEPWAPAQIAQLVEQRIENPRVRGSNPRLGTIKINDLDRMPPDCHVATCCN